MARVSDSYDSPQDLTFVRRFVLSGSKRKFLPSTKMRRLVEVESEVNAIRSRMGKGSYFTEQEINLVQLIRTMENKLDKTSTKIAEANHIKHAYEVIRDKLIGVSSFSYNINLNLPNYWDGRILHPREKDC